MPCLRFRYFLRCQHLIRRFGYADIFVVPARLGKGGGLFPFLARTLTLPDDVELLGALTPCVRGGCARRRPTKPNRSNSIQKSRGCHRRSRPLHAHVRTFYPYVRKKHRQLSAYRSSCKTACEQPTSFASSQKASCTAPVFRPGSEQRKRIGISWHKMPGICYFDIQDYELSTQ